MPTTTTIDDRGFIRVTLSGSWPTRDELKELRKQLDGSSGNGLVLADMRNVTGEFPYHDEIRLMVGRIRGNKASAARRRAVLVGSDLQFGIARVFQSLLPGEVEVFRDEAAAMAWLLGDGDTHRA